MAPSASSLEACLNRLWFLRLPGLKSGDIARWNVVLRLALAAAAWVVGLTLIGLVWAWTTGFLNVVVASAQQLVPLAALTYIMALQICWSAGMVEAEILPSLVAFEQPSQARQRVESFVSGTVRWWWLPLVVYLGAAAIAAWRATSGSGGPALFTGAIDVRWFLDPLFPKVTLIIFWLIPPILIAAIGTWGLLLLQIMTHRLATLEVVDRPVLVLHQLRRYVLFCQLAAVGWSCDLLMYYVASFARPGLLSVSFFVAATFVAFIALLYPHLEFHMTLRRMAGRVTKEMSCQADEALNDGKLSSQDRVRVWAQVAVDPPITWLYDLRFMIGPMIAAAGTASVGYFGLR